MIETIFAILIALLIWKAAPWPLAGQLSRLGLGHLHRYLEVLYVLQ